jgi:hypothetical protein
MSKIDPKFIVDLKGKQFVTYEGLLDLAHQEGLIGITTELIQIPSEINNYLAIVQAKATTKDKSFMGIGDCDNKSANSMIAPHKIRMAETRAKARALRDLTNVGMTAIEELGETEEVSTAPMQPKGNLSEGQIKRLYAIAKAAGVNPEQVKASVLKDYKKDNEYELTRKEYEELCNRLEKAKK